MSGEVRILIAGSEVGSYPKVLPLNSRFRSDLPLLKLQVDIDWNPRAPAQALSSLEKRLVELCPSLRRHECRGHRRYHILCSDEQKETGREPIEVSLALAHLLEHVLIDALAFITSAPLVSGITGAHKDSARRFDIFVECPDPSLAPLVVRLAVSWISALLDGTSLDGAGRPTLELVRVLYQKRSEPLPIEKMAEQLGREPDAVRACLLWLEQNGFARKEPCAKNRRERDCYRLQGRS